MKGGEGTIQAMLHDVGLGTEIMDKTSRHRK